MKRLLAVLMVLVTGAVHSYDVGATTWTWSKMINQVRPPAHYYHTLAFDSLRNKTVLFGGLSATQVHAETWEWDGGSWTLKTPELSPPARYGAGMVFDATRGKTVLFGGVAGDDLATDTWEWDGTSWTEIDTPSSPTPRAYHAMTYDSARRSVVLHGGMGYVGHPALPFVHGDTWLFDGTTWTPAMSSVPRHIPSHLGSSVNPRLAPPPRFGHSMTYDSTRSRVVLFGGHDGTSIRNDTWEFDGIRWEQSQSASLPPGNRYYHSLAFNDSIDRTILFGGSSGTTSFNDTWSWDGSSWTKISTAITPPPTLLHAMVFDSQRARIVMHGGIYSNDTWELSST